MVSSGDNMTRRRFNSRIGEDEQFSPLKPCEREAFRIPDVSLETVNEASSYNNGGDSNSNGIVERRNGDVDGQGGCGDVSLSTSMWRYFWQELGVNGEEGEAPQSTAKLEQHRDRIYTFILIPLRLEGFLWFPWLLCFDIFLYIFTILPLRVAKSLTSLIVALVTIRIPCLPSSQRFDLLKAFVILLSTFLLTQFDMSMAYHLVRGQSVIKLYILFNMLDIADKLLTSVGQDMLDAMYLSATEMASATTERPRRKRDHIGLIGHLLLCVVYTIVHVCLMALQVVALNVAFNSHSKSLLTIMISNNFVEIKGNVFRKFGKNNLFQIACSDGRERFHLMLLMALVAFRNCAQYAWSFSHLTSLLPDMMYVLGAELVVDWVKHAFIVKFNEMPADVYSEFKLRLCKDVRLTRNRGNEKMELLSARLGFSPLPCACLTLVAAYQALSTSAVLPPLSTLIVWALPAGALLVVMKCAVGCVVHVLADRFVEQSTAKTSSNEVEGESSRKISTSAGLDEENDAEDNNEEDGKQTEKRSRSAEFTISNPSVSVSPLNGRYRRRASQRRFTDLETILSTSNGLESDVADQWQSPLGRAAGDRTFTPPLIDVTPPSAPKGMPTKHGSTTSSATSLILLADHHLALKSTPSQEADDAKRDAAADVTSPATTETSDKKSFEEKTDVVGDSLTPRQDETADEKDVLDVDRFTMVGNRIS